MTPCDEYWDLLNAFVDGECSPEEEAALRAHLETCGSCRAALADLTAIQDAIAWDAGGADDFTDSEFWDGEPVPEGFTEAVLAKVAKTPQAAAPKKRGHRFGWRVLAACLALMLLVGRFSLGGRSASTANTNATGAGAVQADSPDATADNDCAPYSAGQENAKSQAMDRAADLCWTLTAAQEADLFSGYDAQETEEGRVYTLTETELAAVEETAQAEGLSPDAASRDQETQTALTANDSAGENAGSAASGSAEDPAGEDSPEVLFRVLVLPQAEG